MNYNIMPVKGHKLADIDLVTRAVKVLADNYQGYQWRVFIDEEVSGGVMRIISDDVNARIWANHSYGYTLHLTTVYQDPNLDCVKRAGGEILERAGLIRGKHNGEVTKHVYGVEQNHQPLNGIII